MKGVEFYAQVRYAVQIEGVEPTGSGSAFRDRPADGSEDAGIFVPPGYRRSRPPARPKLDPFTGIIGILAADEGPPRKQRHTSKRIFERLLCLGQPGEVSGMVPIAGGACSRRADDPEGTIRLLALVGHRAFPAFPRCRGYLREASCLLLGAANVNNWSDHESATPERSSGPRSRL
jgi:hypothetical protein